MGLAGSNQTGLGGARPGWGTGLEEFPASRPLGEEPRAYPSIQISGSPDVLSSFPGPPRAGGPSLPKAPLTLGPRAEALPSQDQPLLSSGHQHGWWASCTLGFRGCRSRAPGSQPSGWGAPSPLSQMLLFLLFLSNLSWGKWPQ